MALGGVTCCWRTSRAVLMPMQVLIRVGVGAPALAAEGAAYVEAHADQLDEDGRP